ncbi:alkaline phosphatase [Lingula anatina]|uniref:alkaline phosphatase n=1 Tax=Lingula anatina TaxID=7574 RepID=A0A1S3JAP8_LINAN|nr:alkaline phosphatase [Lingula anatina]|eukprot:XP_013407398.1 alkaline phosphatase [Lingula anatina]
MAPLNGWFVVWCLLLMVGTQEALEPQLKDYWYKLAQEELKKALNTKPNTNVAKNVILFLGDGMGVSTLTAARIYKGQQAGRPGEEGTLAFESFPHAGLAKTYNTDRQTADSAGTATAFLCGAKTKSGLIGLDDRAVRGNCSSEKGGAISSILKWSNSEGKSTGVVSTARVTHATPASGYAHSADRNWEADADMPESARTGCSDIAAQLVGEDGSFLNVILGGGRSKFLPNTTADPEWPGKNGSRVDGRNLIEDWSKSKKEPSRARYVWNLDGFKAVDPIGTDYLLGLFEPSHMQYELDRNKAKEPSLAEMTEKAIKMLRKNPKGFFLLVEGGRIDHGHHNSTAHKALADTIAMDKAVTKALELTDTEDTLIVVTADHSHVFTIGGYASRGNNILGITDKDKDKNGTAYTSLLYANGPGYEAPRPDPAPINTNDSGYQFQSAVQLDSETHGGEDVAIYATGPMSHLFHSLHEQHYIAHMMAYASCVGQNKDHCKEKSAGGAMGLIVAANERLWVLIFVAACAMLAR